MPAKLGGKKGLSIIQYPHPTLRHTSKPLRRVDAELHRAVREMFDLMYEANGVGLAANQVDLPYRFFVMNLEADSKATDQELVFLNPVLTARKGTVEGEEGCLSLPGLYGQVKRTERIVLNAYTLDGQEITLDLDSLAARAVQHEIDHLDGVLFIDRLSLTGQLESQDTLHDMEREFLARRERGEIPPDDQIARRLAELERERT